MTESDTPRRPTPVVLAADVLAAATSSTSTTWRTWPATPPGSLNAAADCLGIVAEPAEWALWLSDDLLLLVVRALLDPEYGYGWASSEVRRYVTALQDIADASGGGTLRRPAAVIGGGAPLPLRAPLDLAAATQAPLIVSDWPRLLRRDGSSVPAGTVIRVLRSRDFQRRVGAARRGI